LIKFNTTTPSKFDEVFSNFVPSKVVLDGVIYPTVEHAYQAAKTELVFQRAMIVQAETPGKAKKLGKHVTLRKDWEAIKYSIMLDLLKQKFDKYGKYTEVLLSTGDEPIAEGAEKWDDREWGLGSDGSGKNLLGRALVEVREWIKKQKSKGATS